MDNTNKTKLSTAALVAGFAILIMAIAAPFAELFVYPKLVIPGMAAETAKNILFKQNTFHFCYIWLFNNLYLRHNCNMGTLCFTKTSK